MTPKERTEHIATKIAEHTKHPFRAPYIRGSETSKGAAARVEKTATTTLERIYGWMVRRRSHGATSDEIAQALKLLPATAGARRRDLELMGAVVKTEDKRLTRNGSLAAVYQAVPGASLDVPKMGRPSKGDLAANRRVTVYLRNDQHADACYLAAMDEMDLSTWIRSVVDREIQAKPIST